jgi:hypothetical protein
MPPAKILSNAASFDRDETLFKLARIAADLANSDGGVLGETARSWTRDLLTQRQGSSNPREAAVSRAVAQLAPERAIAHAHVVFFLQVHAVAKGSVPGTVPSDGYLAFMMLAVNDHIPEWSNVDPIELTDAERVLAPMFLSTIFNRSDDAMRSLLRLTDVMGRYPQRDFPDKSVWEAVQREAFGTTFDEYAELFLTPMYLIAQTWGDDRLPIVFPQEFPGRDEREAALYRRWFNEASVPIEKAVQAFATRPLPSGLLGLPVAFFRTPFIDFGDKLLGLSPWHVKDHVFFGTWAKLNAASKRVLGTDSNQTFASAFGYCFEEACADLAREATRSPQFRDRLILPSQPGADDEIEDVVLLDEDVVALLSAKASLVPEASLKTADGYSDVVRWLRKFFFEEPVEAKKTGYRGGAVYLLDRKVQRLRAGEYEKYGLKRDALVVPGVISFDNVGESGALYNWLERECERRHLFADNRVRPLTVITPENYEGLLALGARGDGICRLLVEKTEQQRKWGPLDRFLSEKVGDSIELRLGAMPSRFRDLANRSIARLREARREEAPTHDQVAHAAYHRWLSRGGGDGRDLEDWLEAERHLRRHA